MVPLDLFENPVVFLGPVFRTQLTIMRLSMVRLWDEPVVRSQAGDVSEVGRIVCHKRQVVDEGRRGDHQIHHWDRDSSLQQAPSDLSELLGTVLVERQDVDVLKEIPDLLKQR